MWFCIPYFQEQVFVLQRKGMFDCSRDRFLGTLRDVYITSGSVTSGMLCKDGVLGIKAVFFITRNQNYI